MEVLKSVAKRLDEAGIPYMVSGSVAMNFYAQPRMTRDIDIIVELMPRDARRLRALFAAEFERRRAIALEGCPVSVAAPEDLVLSKLHWAKDSGSEMQMRDVRNLIDLCQDMDRTYLRRWAADIGVGGLLEKALGNPS